jgi:hypothetical protein
MDRETQFANELQALRTLCDEAAPRDERRILLLSLSPYTFVEPEHQVVFESIQALFPRGPISEVQLRVHLNNRGFPSTDVEKYFQSARAAQLPLIAHGQSKVMAAMLSSDSNFSKPLAIFSLSVAALAVALLFFGGTLRRFARESFMQRVTSAHYEIFCPTGAVFQETMMEFATRRESLFTSLDKKLGDADSNAEIRIIFDPDYPIPPVDDTGLQPYSVTGTTIRTTLKGVNLKLPAPADAEALLYAAWGKPGNAQIARWTAVWLAGDWRGAEIGMAAAQVEQRLGHKKVASLLVDPGGEIASPADRTLLGAAWISEIAEFGGSDAVRKLYSAKMAHPGVAEVTKALGTTPLELDRKWQMWMFAYLAGMSTMPHDSGMPMDMPMAGSN